MVSLKRRKTLTEIDLFTIDDNTDHVDDSPPIDDNNDHVDNSLPTFNFIWKSLTAVAVIFIGVYIGYLVNDRNIPNADANLPNGGGDGGGDGGGANVHGRGVRRPTGAEYNRPVEPKDQPFKPVLNFFEEGSKRQGNDVLTKNPSDVSIKPIDVISLIISNVKTLENFPLVHSLDNQTEYSYENIGILGNGGLDYMVY